jgi:N-acetylmuramoyl-L-alanine amidase
VQVATLLRLLEDITTRLRIPPHLVVAHGDIAPARKRDPGVLFPWQRLARAGFGLWPRTPHTAPPPGFDPWVALRLIGYDLRDPAAAVRAFHRHYRGNEAETGHEGDAAIRHDLQEQLISRPARLDEAGAGELPLPRPTATERLRAAMFAMNEQD